MQISPTMNSRVFDLWSFFGSKNKKKCGASTMEVISESTSTSTSIRSPQPEDSINDQLENLSFVEEPQNDTTTDNNNNNNNNNNNKSNSNGGEEGDVVIRENLEERENDEEENGEEDKEVQDEEVQDEEVVNNVVIEKSGNGNENKNGDRGNLEREKSKRSSCSKYPVRLEAEDCSFYVRTGMCKFGMNCKFNHPPNRKTLGGKVKGKEESGDGAPTQKVKDKEDGSDKEGQIDCKYFDLPAGCKFGKACKFNHSRKSTPMIELNFMGLPIRPGEKECPYYMRNGSCKYGANCRFNHPDPTTLGGSDAQPAYSNGGSVVSSTTSQSTLAPWSPPENPPYVPLMFPPTQGVPSRPEWNAYRAPVYPTERNMHMPAAYAINSQSLERNAYTHQQEQILVDEFPERPGQPECSYFLKTGNCKYRSACKFHHPKIANAKPPPCSLSDLGLPLRPGENVCSYYSRYGICKYGPACKYDHPVNYAHSESLAVPAVDHTPALCNSVASS